MEKITNGDNMNHCVDLSKFNLRTDLAIELIGVENENIVTKKEKIDNIQITSVDILKDGVISKKKGKYITIEFDDVTDFNNKEKVKEVFIGELKKLLKHMDIKDDFSCLAIGLGNVKSTPDSLGPDVIDNFVVTNHLFMVGDVGDGFRKTYSIKPGVTGETGIETSELIKGIVKTIKPDFIIVIDALASQSIDRVLKTIQMTDTGIHPGSGVGNSRKEISSDTLGIPVIAIGVPMVVDAVTIVSDTINYMYKHFSYTKENINNPISKLIVGGVDYRKKDVNVKENEKSELLGLVGNLSEKEIKQLIFEVLTPISFNLMVTPKETDFVLEKLVDIIGNGLNRALHKKISEI